MEKNKNNTNTAWLATYILVTNYNKLLELLYTSQEDTPEFKELLDKIKKCVDVENETYSKLSQEFITSTLDSIHEDQELDPYMIRYYNKLVEQKRINRKDPCINNILLSDVISTKISIDLLKILEETMKKLEDNDSISERDLAFLRIHHINSKFQYFTSNNFFEQYALEYNFDIDEMPPIDFKEIEQIYGIDFTKTMSKTLADYIIGSMQEIKELKDEDKYYISYKGLLELARVEAMLPYLDIETIKDIESRYEAVIDENITVRQMKKKIKQKKEELNNN